MDGVLGFWGFGVLDTDDGVTRGHQCFALFDHGRDHGHGCCRPGLAAMGQPIQGNAFAPSQGCQGKQACGQ